MVASGGGTVSASIVNLILQGELPSASDGCNMIDLRDDLEFAVSGCRGAVLPSCGEEPAMREIGSGEVECCESAMFAARLAMRVLWKIRERD